MTRIAGCGLMLGVLTAGAAAASLALSTRDAGAQSVAVKVAPVKGVHVNPPNPNVTGAIAGQQRASDQGVQINIRHKRDQLQGNSGGTNPQ